MPPCPRCSSRARRKGSKVALRSDCTYLFSSKRALGRLCQSCMESLMTWYAGDGLPLGDEVNESRTIAVEVPLGGMDWGKL